MIAEQEPRPKRYLTVREAAEVADARTESVWRWVTKGVRIAGQYIRLAAVRYGRDWKIRPEDLEHFRVRCESASRGEPVAPQTPAAERRQADKDVAEAKKVLNRKRKG